MPKAPRDHRHPRTSIVACARAIAVNPIAVSPTAAETHLEQEEAALDRVVAVGRRKAAATHLARHGRH